MSPTATFIIPAYNQCVWLPHSVKSALAQTHKATQVVIVNDASTDMTSQYLKWLEAQKDERIKIITNKTNLGRSESRNIGNEAADGIYLFVLDADDLAAPNRVELTLKKFTASGAQFIYGSATVMDALGNKINEVRADVFNLEAAMNTKYNRIVHSSVAYTKQFALSNKYESGEIAELGIDDWAQQIKAAQTNKFDFVPQTICAQRVHGYGITSTRDESKVLAAKTKYLESLKVPVAA